MTRPKFTVDRYLLLGSALLLVIISLAVTSYDMNREWRYYQSDFGNVVAELLGEEAAARVPRGIQQLWVQRLDRVDRCTTCHQGITWRGLEQAPQPYTTHPDMPLFKAHPVEEYGCSICHGGQGSALTTFDAHGFDPHWEEPLLGRDIAGDYLMRDTGALLESNCNVCHRHERQVEGMPRINRAKDLMAEKSCRVCHIINGVGGGIGPDLSNVGDKHAEGMDFSNFAGRATLFNWHINHFKNPQAVIPGSIMPELGFNTQDAQAMSLLMLSWRKTDFPIDYYPTLKLVEERTPEEIAREERMLSGEGAFFIKKGCFVCHSISAYDIKSPTDKGPDLSDAVDDVRIRFSMSLDEFVFTPRGTMEIIFGSMIVLTDEEKWSVIEKLRKAYDLKQKQLRQAISMQK